VNGAAPPPLPVQPPPAAGPSVAGAGWLPGPLARKLVLVLALAVLLAGAAAAWLVSHAADRANEHRLVAQQNDEVELVARLLGSKIEQSQKVLSTMAERISPAMLDSPATLEWLLQQGLPAVRFFDSMLVARQDGRLGINLRNGQLRPASELDPAERDYLVRTMVGGKPLVSGVIGRTPADARIMFTMPLLQGDAHAVGVIAGVLRLQSQGLLPHSLALPPRAGSSLIVFTHDGIILSHPDMQRVLGQVRDEPGLGAVYQRWRSQDQVLGGVATEWSGDHVVSLASVAMPRWIVARVSDTQALRAPLQGLRRDTLWQTGAAVALVGLLAAGVLLWLVRPLTLLRLHAQAFLQASAADPHAERLLDTLEGGQPWPRSAGEVDDVVRACSRLVQHRLAQQRDNEAVLQQLQAVLAHAPLGLAVTRGAQVSALSLQAARLLGQEPAQLRGRALEQLLAGTPQQVAALVAHVRAQFAAHGAYDGALPLLHGNGDAVHLHAQGRCIHPGEPALGTVWLLQEASAAQQGQQVRAWERTHDDLTQLLQRGALEQRLRQLLAERAQVPAHEDCAGALLFMDLDHFTVVNDVAGHEAGDDVLRRLAMLIQAEVGALGWAARVGGDEFAVLLPTAALAQAQAMAERLRRMVHDWEPNYQERSFALGLSLGLVPLPTGPADADAVLHAADMACYAAKRAGRNRVETRRLKPSQAVLSRVG